MTIGLISPSTGNGRMRTNSQQVFNASPSLSVSLCLSFSPSVFLSLSLICSLSLSACRLTVWLFSLSFSFYLCLYLFHSIELLCCIFDYQEKHGMSKRIHLQFLRGNESSKYEVDVTEECLSLYVPVCLSVRSSGSLSLSLLQRTATWRPLPLSFRQPYSVCFRLSGSTVFLGQLDLRCCQGTQTNQCLGLSVK